MRELNEKLIILIALGLLAICLSLNFFFPLKKSLKSISLTSIKEYVPVGTAQANLSNAEWPEAKEQALGEMFDLFTPPEIYINENGEFVFRPPYAVNPTGPFGVDLIDIRLDPYRFQLEGFVEDDRNDQDQTTILVHSVEDGKCLRLSPDSNSSTYGFKILDWRIDRNFDIEDNPQVIAWLKLKDELTNRIINLRHDENLYEDDIEIIFKVSKTDELFVLRGIGNSFFVGDIEYKLEDIDYNNMIVDMSKIIPDSDPLTETLSIYVPSEESSVPKMGSDNKSTEAVSIEDAFNSFF